MYDWRALPLSTAAALAAGLPEDSRCMRRLTGQAVPAQTLMLAQIIDNLRWLVWAQTEDARHGRNRPDSLVEKLTEIGNEKNHPPGGPGTGKPGGFATPEEFLAAYARFTGQEVK